MGLFVLLLIGICAPIAFCDPNNGGFESYDYNALNELNRPSEWYYDANYATVVSYLAPFSNRWRIPKGLYAFEGNDFLLLSTGDAPNGPSSSNGTKAWQTIDVNAGDKLTGVYFFGTDDYSTFLDWGEIKLISLADPNKEILVAYADVEDVGSYNSGDSGSMSGWKRFEYIFDANQTGVYELEISVCDYQDSIYDTFLAVDSIILCRNPSGQGDFNCDCTVNLTDFAIIANNWMCNCKDPNVLNDSQSDPNYYNDPNNNCLLGIDMDNNGPVDMNDIEIFTENWLTGTKEDL